MERPLRRLGVEESIVCSYKYSTCATKEDYSIVVKLILKLLQLYLLAIVQWSHLLLAFGLQDYESSNFRWQLADGIYEGT